VSGSILAMLFPSFKSALAASALTAAIAPVAAQTYTTCNPTQGTPEPQYESLQTLTSQQEPVLQIPH